MDQNHRIFEYRGFFGFVKLEALACKLGIRCEFAALELSLAPENDMFSSQNAEHTELKAIVSPTRHPRTVLPRSLSALSATSTFDQKQYSAPP